MTRIPFKEVARPWSPVGRIATVPVVAAPLVAPLAFEGVAWAPAIVVSLTGALLAGLGSVARHLLPEVLDHLRLKQEEANRHHEVMTREGNQHTELLTLLRKVNPSSAFTVDVAAVVQQLRAASTAAGQPSAGTATAAVASTPSRTEALPTITPEAAAAVAVDGGPSSGAP